MTARPGPGPGLGPGALLALLPVLLAACLGPRGGADGGADGARRGSPEELRALIRRSAVAPVMASVETREEAVDPFELGGAPGPTPPPAPQDTGDSLPGPSLTTDEGDSIDAELAQLAAALEVEQGQQAATAAAPLAVSEAALGGTDELPSPGLGGAVGAGSDDGPPLNPYGEFGERIEVRPDGRITKPFQLPVGKGRSMLQLMSLAAPFSFTQAIVASNAADPPAPAVNDDPDVADMVLLEKWDVELLDDFQRASPLQAPKPPQQLQVADWLVVTASPSTLRQVESFIELFAARVPQVEITASVLEVTFSDDFDYGVTGPDGEVLLDFPAGTFVDTFGYSMPNSIEGAEGVLSIGAIQDGVALNAFLEAVQRWENVEIRTNPRIVVREGVTAEIQNQTEIPVFSFTGINVAGNFNAQLTFKSVGTTLFITPRVVGSSTLALNMYLEASQQVGTSVAFTDQEGNEFRAPLIANRQARTIVYLRPDQAVVIGGLSSERVEEAETQVPILGDLPFIGYLFKSVRKRRERTLVMFLISPRVLSTQEFYEDIWPGVTLDER